ncbi:MAG: S8 family serine peptidase [Oscillospiraceae bacterium]|nr:S8 family serine peptidase [Oscillospiraceae bacterium]
MIAAIIDDGIYDDAIILPKLLESYNVLSDGSIKKRGDEKGALTHGTMCAAIIHQINPDIELIDLKILNNEGKASICALLSALTWCYNQSIKLIHMSLGSLNYHDYLKMASMIENLINNNTCIVSAYHNLNLKSYPASIKGVFGVRSDKGNILKDEEYGIDPYEGLSISNCFVAPSITTIKSLESKKISIAQANSFSAPILTGHISRYLQENESATHAQVLSHLQLNATPYKSLSCKIIPYINKGDLPIYGLVIGIISAHNMLSSKLYEIFKRNDYYVESFTHSSNVPYNDNSIPLSYYCDEKQIIGKSILHTIDFIYEPDIIIIELNHDNYIIDWSTWDILIVVKGKKINLLTKKQSSIYDSLESLCSGIISHFSQ